MRQRKSLIAAFVLIAFSAYAIRGFWYFDQGNLVPTANLGTGTANSSTFLRGDGSWASAGGASYLVYTALLTQSGTAAPVATVLQNTLGGTVVWTRDSAGNYSGTLSGAFTASKTFVLIAGSTDIQNTVFFSAIRGDLNTITVQSGDSGGSRLDDYLVETSIEIRVYP